MDSKCKGGLFSLGLTTQFVSGVLGLGFRGPALGQSFVNNAAKALAQSIHVAADAALFAACGSQLPASNQHVNVFRTFRLLSIPILNVHEVCSYGPRRSS